MIRGKIQFYCGEFYGFFQQTDPNGLKPPGIFLNKIINGEKKNDNISIIQSGIGTNRIFANVDITRKNTYLIPTNSHKRPFNIFLAPQNIPPNGENNIVPYDRGFLFVSSSNKLYIAFANHINTNKR